MKKIILAILVFISVNAFAKDKNKIEFTDNIKLAFTPVKNQGSTGSCWSFATTGFLESELLRMGKGEFDLSEMYFALYSYKKKAEQYYLYHGNNNFSQGGQAHDVMNVVREFGIVPDTVLPGDKTDGRLQDHELVSKLTGEIQKSNKWDKKFDASDTKSLDPILEKYIGKVPDNFEYEGKTYTPKSFRDYLGIDPDNYIELTSYSHHPFYKPVLLEIPDNWSHDLYYNLPIDKLMEVIAFSLKNGYTVCWDGDTSEKTFSHKKAIADLPKDEIGKVNQELRQETFYTRKTTDDHLMHLIGISTKEDGRTFFNTKNSWGAGSNDNGGLLYLSVDYVRLKTIAILVHRDAIPLEIAKKLNL